MAIKTLEDKGFVVKAYKFTVSQILRDVFALSHLCVYFIMILRAHNDIKMMVFTIIAAILSWSAGITSSCFFVVFPLSVSLAFTLPLLFGMSNS